MRPGIQGSAETIESGIGVAEAAPERVRTDGSLTTSALSDAVGMRLGKGLAPL
jgi:hypothetical protein